MVYQLYLNGQLYGCGDRKYMKELIADWLHCDMYGQEQAVFKVIKVFPSE